MNISRRKQLILAAIVDRYIETGEPVGSKTICEALNISLSSATIRNEMNELDEMGYLKQPHTSAGRIPTEVCYRLYIDNLMNHYSLTNEDRTRIDSLLVWDPWKDGDSGKLLEYAVKTLSRLTVLPSVTTTPSLDHEQIASINIIPTGRHSILIVIVTSSGTIKNVMTRCQFELTVELLQTLTRFFNERLAGQPLGSINQELINSMTAPLGQFAPPIRKLLDTIYNAIQDITSTKVKLEGGANLFFHKDLQSDYVMELIDFLSEQDRLNSIFGKPHAGVKVIIGSESNIKELSGTSVISARYSVKGKKSGTIGVIGPTRINYAKMISYLRYYAQGISRLLEDHEGEQ